MTEDEARSAVSKSVGEAALVRLDTFVAWVVRENARQNLIAPATEAVVWARHVLDSLQLIGLAPRAWNSWIDIGTGGGFPGMVVAAAAPDRHVVLVEPRKRRAAFLDDAARGLGLTNVEVRAVKIEQVIASGDVISARAVAALEKLLPAAHHCATTATTWILPRGQIGDDELSRLQNNWKGMFHVEPSVTDPRSAIVVATGVERR